MGARRAALRSHNTRCSITGDKSQKSALLILYCKFSSELTFWEFLPDGKRSRNILFYGAVCLCFYMFTGMYLGGTHEYLCYDSWIHVLWLTNMCAITQAYVCYASIYSCAIIRCVRVPWLMISVKALATTCESTECSCGRGYSPTAAPSSVAYNSSGVQCVSAQERSLRDWLSQTMIPDLAAGREVVNRCVLGVCCKLSRVQIFMGN